MRLPAGKKRRTRAGSESRRKIGGSLPDPEGASGTQGQGPGGSGRPRRAQEPSDGRTLAGR